MGIVFKDTDSALRENEDIFKEHLGYSYSFIRITSSLHLTQQYGQVDHSSMYQKA